MNRKQRRSDPDQWWKLNAYAKNEDEVADLPDQYAQYVQGKIDDIIVFSLPSTMSAAERVQMANGIRELFALSGKEEKVVVVPDSVRLMRLRPVDFASSKILERGLSAARAKRKLS